MIDGRDVRMKKKSGRGHVSQRTGKQPLARSERTSGVWCEGGDQRKAEHISARERGGRSLQEEADTVGDEGSKWDRSERGRIASRESRALRLAFLRRMKSE